MSLCPGRKAFLMKNDSYTCLWVEEYVFRIQLRNTLTLKSGSCSFFSKIHNLTRPRYNTCMCQNTIASIFGCVLKVEGKSLLLKSPQSLDTGLVRLELYANLKALSLRFSFHSTKRCYAGCQWREEINCLSQL